jgi:cytochrome c biogenesis protein CcmG, thiol:disulfide interchange protein DsbE
MQTNANPPGARTHPLVPVVIAAVLLAALIASGCGGSDEGSSPPPDYTRMLRSAPPPLAALYQQGDKVTAADPDRVRTQLDALRGYPVVVNAWASWCGPCRTEFPFFQKMAAKYGDRVAFLGLDTYDSADAAETFLREAPLPYPSFTNEGWDLQQEFVPGVRGLPKTAYYAPSGKLLFVDEVPYTSLDELQADIRKYAL